MRSDSELLIFTFEGLFRAILMQLFLQSVEKNSEYLSVRSHKLSPRKRWELVSLASE